MLFYVYLTVFPWKYREIFLVNRKIINENLLGADAQQVGSIAIRITLQRNEIKNKFLFLLFYEL